MRQITNKEYEDWQKYKAERTKAASTCQYGVIRATKPIIISEDDMLPSYSDGFRR